MSPQDLVDDLRRRINPAYANTLGTESHERRICADAIEGLLTQLAAERERADYAWRNANVIEKARQEEMAKRDLLQAEVATLRHHLTELAKLADRAALVLVTIEAEDTTESEMLQEIIDGIQIWAPDAMRGQVAVPPAPTFEKK